MADAGISLNVMGAAVFLHTVDRGGMFQLAVAVRLVLAVGAAGNEAHARHLPFRSALFPIGFRSFLEICERSDY